MDTEVIDKRGIIFRDTSVGYGVASIDGHQISFDIGIWKSTNPPRVGMKVLATFDAEGQIASMREIPDTQIAREQADQFKTAALKHKAVLTEGIRKHFGITVFAVELILLLSFFLLPSLSIAYTGRSLTAWDVLGLDFVSFSTNDHGLISFLAAALFAPLAAPFVHKVWARWLYGAPLAFALVVLSELLWQIDQAGAAVRNATGGFIPDSMTREMSRQAMGLIHVNFGVLPIVACSIYLATRIFKPNT